MAITVRAGTVADMGEIQSLYRQLDDYHVEVVPEVFQPVASDVRSTEMVKQALDSEDAAFLLAELEDTVVGFFKLRMGDAPDYPVFRRRRFLLVEDAVVREGYRGRGVGTALLRATVAWAKERGIRYIQTAVWDTNIAATQFYLANGFKPMVVRMELDVEADL